MKLKFLTCFRPTPDETKLRKPTSNHTRQLKFLRRIQAALHTASSALKRTTTADVRKSNHRAFFLTTFNSPTPDNQQGSYPTVDPNTKTKIPLIQSGSGSNSDISKIPTGFHCDSVSGTELSSNTSSQFEEIDSHNNSIELKTSSQVTASTTDYEPTASIFSKTIKNLNNILSSPWDQPEEYFLSLKQTKEKSLKFAEQLLFQGTEITWTDSAKKSLEEIATLMHKVAKDKRFLLQKEDEEKLSRLTNKIVVELDISEENSKKLTDKTQWLSLIKNISKPNPKVLDATCNYLEGWIKHHNCTVVGMEKIQQLTQKKTPILFVFPHSLYTWDIVYFLAITYNRTNQMPHMLIDNLLSGIPFVGRYLKDLGALPANRQNYTIAAQQGDSIGLAPGGMRDSKRITNPGDPQTQKHQLDWGNNIGFAKMAQTTDMTIVPVVCPGADEIYNVKHIPWLTKFAFKYLHLPLVIGTSKNFFPFFPFGSALFSPPDPHKLTYYVGEPITPNKEETFQTLAEKVKTATQTLLTESANNEKPKQAIQGFPVANWLWVAAFIYMRSIIM